MSVICKTLTFYFFFFLAYIFIFCRRLFLDYHGLKLLWGWMVDASSAGNSSENVQFKIDLLSTLSSLPVPNKTMLLDSKLISIVEKWTTISEPQLENVKLKTEDESIKTEEGLNETQDSEIFSQVIHILQVSKRNQSKTTFALGHTFGDTIARVVV